MYSRHKNHQVMITLMHTVHGECYGLFLSITHNDDYRKMLSRVRKWQLYRLFLFLYESINYNGGYVCILTYRWPILKVMDANRWKKVKTLLLIAQRIDDITKLLQSKMTIWTSFHFGIQNKIRKITSYQGNKWLRVLNH